MTDEGRERILLTFFKEKWNSVLSEIRFVIRSDCPSLLSICSSSTLASTHPSSPAAMSHLPGIASQPRRVNGLPVTSGAGDGHHQRVGINFQLSLSTPPSISMPSLSLCRAT